MFPSKYFLCSFENCNSIFTRASDLKKHEVGHLHPEKIFRCAICSFVTLQKKNLAIHLGRHTGEKPLHCPHTVPGGDSSYLGNFAKSPTIEQQCDFRTNDPAALTRHRKVHHGYVPARRGPVPNGARVPSLIDSTTAFAQVEGAVQGIKHRVAFLVPADPDDSSSDCGYSSPEPPRSPAMLTWTGDVNAYREEMSDIESSELDDGRSLTSRFSTLSSCDHAALQRAPINLYTALEPDMLYVNDPTESYMVEVERIRSDLEMELHEEDIFNLKTGREGCLCPKWMVEAGIEGWDASVLDLHKDYYAPLASASV